MIDEMIKVFKREGIWLEGESPDIDVKAMTADSRIAEKASESTIFFARRGVAKDGHEYLKSIENVENIAAFVVEEIPESFKPKAPVIVVRDATYAMALAVKDFYGDPTKDSFCVAVTGTNGKTTTTCILQALLKSKGMRPVRTGTIETEFEGQRIASELTTPDFAETQKSFSELKAKGADAFVFEASSHALEQRRLLGMELDAALFTNLSPEHLDYHSTMDSYYAAKRKVFLELLTQSKKQNKLAIVGEDGSYGSRLIEDLKGQRDMRLLRWGFEAAKGDYLHIRKWKTNLEGSSLIVDGFGLKGHEFKSNLIGRFNIENLAGVICFGLALNMDTSSIQNALDTVPLIPGRLEKVGHAGHIFVDYAHTPDALENVLMTLRPLTKGRLRVVFGCGGDRDRTKRPKMGEIAELHADELFVTSDNPRTENPESIIEEILKGVQRLKPIQVDVSRENAIKKSLLDLKSEDVVLIAGKGHENYQIIGTKKYPFDDREIVSSALGD